MGYGLNFFQVKENTLNQINLHFLLSTIYHSNHKQMEYLHEPIKQDWICSDLKIILNCNKYIACITWVS